MTTSDNSNQKTIDLSHLIVGIGGALAGVWWANSELSEFKKSRAEKDHPDEVAEACEAIGELLDDWAPVGLQTEAEYTNDLFVYLRDNADFEIEMRPNTLEGFPDILVENLLALEIKLDPKKTERDRLVGQCAGYSRQWVTWAIVIDASASKIGKIENLLADKGLAHILVVPFD